MSDPKALAAAFVRKNQGAPLVSARPINAFDAIFNVQELTPQESAAIEQIVVDGSATDIAEIKRITKELRAIRRQEFLLVGERIAAAREIFQKYGEKSFKQWLGFAFGSFKSGYNYLSYFDLYSNMPAPLKNRLRDMPAKAVYVLASKKAPIEQKAEIVEQCAGLSARELIDIIQELFGRAKSKVKKEWIDQVLDSMKFGAGLLAKKKGTLSAKQRTVAKAIAEKLLSL